MDGSRMFSGNSCCNGLRGILFPIAVIASFLALLLPFVTILASDSPGLIGIPYTQSPVFEDSDVFEQAWQFWWVSSALNNGQDPRFCPLIYAPAGASLAYNHLGWFDTLLFAVMGIGQEHPALSHTLSLLLGTILTAVFGWFLARSWGADRYGALFAALAMAWMPSRITRLLQHYQLANCWTLPAAMWLCRKYLEDSRLRILAAFSAVAVFGALQSPFFTIFILLGLAATCFAVRGSWIRTGYLAAAWLISVAVLAILVFAAPGDPGSVATPWRLAIYWAPEPQSFILPSPFGAAGYLTGIPMKFSWMSNTAEGVVTPGLTILAAFVVLIWKKKCWKFAIIVLALWILALGPELRIFGRPLGIPLPFRIMQLFPVFDGIRTPSRFALLGGIFVAAGAGMGVSLLKAKWKLLFFALLILELWVPAFSTLPTSIPSACRNIPAGRIVIELPVDNHVRRYSLFQTATSYSRRYAFLARLNEFTEEDAFLQEAIDEGHILIYHRWLFNESDRNRYDTLYAELFPESSASDSVWIFDCGGAP